MTTFVNSVRSLISNMTAVEVRFAERSFTRGFSAVQTAAMIREQRS